MTQNAFAKFRQGAAAPVRPIAQPGPVGVAPAPYAAPMAAQSYQGGAVNRYAGVQANNGRFPQPQPGKYLFKVLKTYETRNPGKGQRTTYHADMEVVTVDPHGSLLNAPGSIVSFIQIVDGTSASMGPPRVKAFVIAATGFDTEEDYNQMDPAGQFMNATAGAPGMVYPDGSPIVQNPLGGVFVAATVSQGKPVLKNGAPTGEFYADFAWEPAADPTAEGGA